jgi:diketogulonate reductase-like aldo/keto reductase
VIIPKSVSPKRIKSNAEIFDFEIPPEDVKEVRTTPSSARKP